MKRRPWRSSLRRGGCAEVFTKADCGRPWERDVLTTAAMLLVLLVAAWVSPGRSTESAFGAAGSTSASESGEWVAVAPMPTPRIGLAAATGSDGRIYVIGGDPAGELSSVSTVEAYSPSTDTWASVASMATPRRGLAAVAGRDGRIYAIGGRNEASGDLATVEVYTPSSNSWTGVAPLPMPMSGRISGLAATLGRDGRVYVIGASGDTVVYTPGTDSWTTVAPLPTPRLGFAAATGTDGRIYAIGGDTGGSVDTVEAYTPGTNTWAAVASMDTEHGYLAAVAAGDGRIYALGGWTIEIEQGNSTGAVEAYSPSANRWAPAPSLLGGAQGLAAAAAGNRIYAFGGYRTFDGPPPPSAQVLELGAPPDSNGPFRVSPLWRVDLPFAHVPIVTAPTLAEGAVYVGSWNGQIWAFPADCGSGWANCTPLWVGRANIEEPSDLFVADGVLYVGGDKLYAFPADCRRDGGVCSPLWTGETGGLPFLFRPTAADGAVYIVAPEGTLYAFRADCGTGGANCAPLWTGQIGPGFLPDPPAVDEGVVYAVSGEGKLSAFGANCGTDGATCSPLWTASAEAGPFARPVASGGVVYVRAGTSRLAAFAADCGTGGEVCSPLWTATTAQDTTFRSSLLSPTVVDGVVYVSAWASLYAFPADCGAGGAVCSALWMGEADTPIVSNPAVVGGIVYVTSGAGTLFGFPVGCGTGGATCPPRSTVTTGLSISLGGGIQAGPRSSAGAASDGVYAIVTSKKLYAFGLGDHEQPTVAVAPARTSNPLGATQTVTATIATSRGPLADAPIRFHASGANVASRTVTSDPNGRASFAYSGVAEGTDTIIACYDRDRDNACDAGEPSASAGSEWHGAVPTCLGLEATNGNVATEGDDVLVGTPGPDVIDGLGGDDLICGRADQHAADVGDVLSGGGGADRVFAREGNDTLYGYRAGGDDPADGIEDGNDRLFGEAGSDHIEGGPGDDLVSGGEGNDTFLLGDDGNFGEDDDGNDFVSGGAGNDGTLRGAGGDDRVFGGEGNDNDLLGGSGDDRVAGGAGDDDDVLGQRGNDRVEGNGDNDSDLDGGEGNDMVTGGNGDDTLFGSSGDDHLDGGSGTDSADGDGGLEAGPGTDTCSGEATLNCELLGSSQTAIQSQE